MVRSMDNKAESSDQPKAVGSFDILDLSLAYAVNPGSLPVESPSVSNLIPN